MVVLSRVICWISSCTIAKRGKSSLRLINEPNTLSASQVSRTWQAGEMGLCVKCVEYGFLQVIVSILSCISIAELFVYTCQFVDIFSLKCLKCPMRMARIS